MAQLRWRVIALLVWFTIFFNIERLNIGSDNTINLASAVYIIGALAAFVALSPHCQRRSIALLLVPTLALYVAVLVLSGVPILGGVHTYLTFTSLFMLVVTVMLAYWVGQSFEEFIQAVETITFSNKGGRLRNLTDAQEMVQLEMISSRRRQRPLSLVLMQADVSSLNMTMHQLVQEVQRSMMQRYVLATITRVLSKCLRRTDLIVEDNQPGRLVCVAPETAESEAIALGQRMARIAKERLGISARFSIAAFPEQALTFEELLNVAEQRLRNQLPAQADALEPEEEIATRAEQALQDHLTVNNTTEAARV